MMLVLRGFLNWHFLILLMTILIKVVCHLGKAITIIVILNYVLFCWVLIEIIIHIHFGFQIMIWIHILMLYFFINYLLIYIINITFIFSPQFHGICVTKRLLRMYWVFWLISIDQFIKLWFKGHVIVFKPTEIRLKHFTMDGNILQNIISLWSHQICRRCSTLIGCLILHLFLQLRLKWVLWVLLWLRIIKHWVWINNILTQRFSLPWVWPCHRLGNTRTWHVFVILQLSFLTVFDVSQLKNIFLRVESRSAFLRGCSCSKLALHGVISCLISCFRAIQQSK